MNMPDLVLKGVFVPHITPFTKSGGLDIEALKKCVRFWLENGVSGLVPCGSNGEAPYLSRQERKKVIETVVNEVKGKIPVLAGTGSMGTRETIALTRDAADVGADAALVVTPFYYRLSSEELCQHYRSVSEAVDLPIVVYTVPKFTGISLEPAFIHRLAVENKSVIGIKDSSGNLGGITETIRLTGERFSVLAGTADIVLPTLSAGGKGAVVAVANVFPAMCRQLYKAFTDGQYEKAAGLQNTVSFINEVLVKKFNQLSAIKEAMRMTGLPVGYPRRPALLLTEAQKKTLEALLKEIGTYQNK
jgi:4-hydroxy-tetrahydrodipicolinate synthase